MQVPALDILDTLRCERAPGESLYETAARLVTLQVLLETGGRQRAAARLAGVSVRKMNYHAKDLGLRPKDRRAAEALAS